MNKYFFSLLLAISWFVGTLVLLLMPGKNVPDPGFFSFEGADKIVHVIIFALLVFLFCRVVLYKKSISLSMLMPYFYFVTLVLFVYGIVIELLQHFVVAGRSFSFFDILADGLGCVLGLLSLLWVYKKGRPL